MKRDPNDILREEGEDALRSAFDAAATKPYRGRANGHAKGASSDKAPRYPLLRFNDLRPSTAPAYLVKGLLPRVGLAAIWGPPKCGKSFWFFDLLLHVALGWEYRGKRVQQGPIVYCAFEGAEGFKARAEAFRRKHKLDPGQNVPLFLMPMRLDLIKDHAALIAAIREQVGDAMPVAVGLDTLNRSLAGSESSDEDMSAYVNASDAIREAFTCLVGIVHHCGVDGTRPRGHTSLTGAVEAQIAVKRDTSDNIVVTVEHMKDGPEGEVLTSRLETLEVGTDDEGDPITSCVIVPGEGEVQERARVTGAAAVALDLLNRALTDAGERPPASNHIPFGVKTVVTLNLWRQYCYAGTVTDSEDPNAKRQGFHRASQKLQQIKAIGVWNDLVWITP